MAPQAVGAYADAVRRDPGTVWSGPVTYLPPGLDEDALRRPWELDDPHPARPAPAPGQEWHTEDPALFWSLSFALSADAWERSGGFCERYVGYGGEDTDFAVQALDRGVRLGWVGAARAYHQHHPVESPPVRHAAAIVRNARLFHDRWGWWPMTGWLRALADLGIVCWRDDSWHLSPTTRGET